MTTNVLKIIAIIAMIIDHIGSYFRIALDENIYYIFRSVGRIVMPIFLYLLVQGFFHTSNIKRYIFRIFCLATITQTAIFIMGMVNQLLFPNYYTQVNEYIGILYSYTLSLILISMIEYKTMFKCLNNTINLILRIAIIVLIFVIYMNIKVEFDMRIPFMCIELYIIEKLFMDKDKKILFTNRKFENKAQKIVLKLAYLSLILLAFVTSLDFSKFHPGYKYSIIYSISPIALYNGQLGRRNKFIKTMFYAVFPLQHIILYLLAMICTNI